MARRGLAPTRLPATPSRQRPSAPFVRGSMINGMDHVIAARAQMGTSLAFHIVFAALGVGLPLLVFAAEGLWLRTKDRAYYDLARTWAKGMAILFVVGAMSGTVLTFELGLLW